MGLVPSSDIKQRENLFSKVYGNTEIVDKGSDSSLNMSRSRQHMLVIASFRLLFELFHSCVGPDK